ncbi:helix-turn-helix domain-containing protein [Segetibacter aerophilus]|uniref:Helix-turn-helix domain-containing protein n=1 Tax=Segetibacter aerophilus TaxID=670293 RepID=A0A512BC03_9BACT|nr:helix-turn-helix domain-containing protein [Segetibacter aerophilus]GEO09490.1 hypothetical protein SAE01_19860 [Segetibacter aerophilus]
MQDYILSPFTRDELKLDFSEVVKKEFQNLLSALQDAKPANAPRFLTRKQAAAKLSISLPTLNEWTKTGKVIGYRVASRVRYKEDELESSLSKIKTRRN